MRSMTPGMVSSVVQVTTARVITEDTGSASTAGPFSPRIRTTSRSEMMPATRPAPSTATMAPMRCSARLLTASVSSRRVRW